MSPTRTLSFSSHFANNALIILDALAMGDMQTARKLEDDLSDLRHSDSTSYCRIIQTANRQEMLAALASICKECARGLRPIIHIEAHGNKEKGIAVGDSNEFISWSDLESAFSAINVEAKNNLGVVMASCYGLYAISPLRIGKPSPFYFLIGPDTEVSAGYIREQMKFFYRALFHRNSLDEAMKMVETRFKQFHSEQFFFRVFAGFLKNGCTGKGARGRVERLVSEKIDEGIPRNRENLRRLRKGAKSIVKPSATAFYRCARLFLHGRIPTSFEQLLSFVQKKDASVP